MPEPVILGAVRTPFGRRQGAFRETRPDQLLAYALQGVIQRVKIDPKLIEDVVNGTVTQINEQGANVGRLGVLLAGLPVQVPAVTLNRMCGSSQQAVHFAAQAIAAGDMNYAIGCGVESMTRVTMASDVGGSYDKINRQIVERYDLIHQGESAERLADRWGIRREECDTLAAESHRKASEAARARKNAEILPTPGLDPEGKGFTFSRDEGVRDTVDRAKMATLATVFRPAGNGVVTAGNSSQISDGASAVLVGDRERAVADGFKPRARFRARVVAADDPSIQLTAVVPAAQRALQKAGLTLKDIDWIEINEAFATVVAMWVREMKADLAKVNPWGGAMGHGHPLGATGAGLMAKMLTGLEATGGTFGLQVMCIGHGMATATIIERV